MVAQTVKNLPTIWETQVQSLGWEDFGFYVSYSKLAICFTFGNLVIYTLVIYMFQCYSLESSHSLLRPNCVQKFVFYVCLLCCLASRVISTIFLVLDSIYMH